MRSITRAAALGVAMLIAPTLAHAGVYTDDMAKCLVKSSAPTDQKILVTWIFGALGQSPDIHQYMNMTAVEHADISKQTARLFERLLTVDCRTETVAAVKYEGTAAIEGAFGVLGQVATRGLMNDAAVMKDLGGLDSYIDTSKITAVMKEAGVTSAPAAQPK